MSLFKKEESEFHKIIHILGIKFSIKKKDVKLKHLKDFISNEIALNNIIASVHSKTFPKYKNVYRRQDIAIIATGPTMKYYRPLENVFSIGLNKAYQRNDINFDYLFAQDYRAVKCYIEDMLKYPAQKFFGTYHDSNFPIDLNAIIPIKYCNADISNINTYFTKRYEGRLNPYIENCALAEMSSVAFSAMQFALYTNPSKIYLVGCDCSNSGYFDGTKQYVGKCGSSHLIVGWQKIKEFASIYYPDVEIVSINPVGLKGMFRDVYTEEYLENSTFIKDKKLNG